MVLTRMATAPSTRQSSKRSSATQSFMSRTPLGLQGLVVALVQALETAGQKVTKAEVADLLAVIDTTHDGKARTRAGAERAHRLTRKRNGEPGGQAAELAAWLCRLCR